MRLAKLFYVKRMLEVLEDSNDVILKTVGWFIQEHKMIQYKRQFCYAMVAR
jgi:hypothetical protein